MARHRANEQSQLTTRLSATLIRHGGAHTEAEMSQILETIVLSPHFDDAVFSCGAYLARHPGTVVLTVFAGVPPDGVGAPSWDQRCGFDCPQAAMRARHDENVRALATLGVRGEQLPLLDQQYGGEGEGLVAALTDTLSRIGGTRVLLPLGLFHEDHVRVSNAGLFVCGLLGRACIAYEDALYRCKPGLVRQRFAELAGSGVCAIPWRSERADIPAKVRAVKAYASQLRALGLTPGEGDDARPEHYWRLVPPVPAGCRTEENAHA